MQDNILVSHDITMFHVARCLPAHVICSWQFRNRNLKLGIAGAASKSPNFYSRPNYDMIHSFPTSDQLRSSKWKCDALVCEFHHEQYNIFELWPATFYCWSVYNHNVFKRYCARILNNLHPLHPASVSHFQKTCIHSWKHYSPVINYATFAFSGRKLT